MQRRRPRQDLPASTKLMVLYHDVPFPQRPSQKVTLWIVFISNLTLDDRGDDCSGAKWRILDSVDSHTMHLSCKRDRSDAILRCSQGLPLRASTVNGVQVVHLLILFLFVCIRLRFSDQ